MQEIEELYEAKCREGEVWNGIFYFSSDNFILLMLLRVLDRKNKLLTVSAFCFLNPIAPFNELEPRKRRHTQSLTVPIATVLILFIQFWIVVLLYHLLVFFGLY